MSRICLLEGTWRKYHGLGNETTWLQAAADAAKQLIDGGKHSLHKGAPGRTYNELHSTEELGGNKEVIFFQRHMREVQEPIMFNPIIEDIMEEQLKIW